MNERVFYIEQDADISELISALKNTKTDTVIFVLPQKSLMFESVVNLQILRNEAEKNKKDIIIISQYARGQELCASAGIEVYPTLEHWEKKLPDDAITAKKNPSSDFSHSRITRVPIVPSSADNSDTKKMEMRPPNWREMIVRPSWQALLALVMFSVALFFLLSFLAFPGAVIEIRPEKKALEIITNIEIKNAEKFPTLTVFEKRNSILGFPVESVFEKAMDFSTISKEFRGTHATGEVVIYNNFLEEKRLRPTTRFQTETGLVFRISDWVVVPEAVRDGSGTLVPGKRVVQIIADENDIFGEIVGARGNIGPTEFFLPGLPTASQTELWGVSVEAFSGGTTDWVPRVRQEDIDAAKRNIETDLLTSTEEELSTFVAAKNEREQSDLAVLLGEKFLKKEVLDIVIEDSILGTSKESFFISAKLKVRTWAYSRSDLYNLLWNELSAKTDRRMKLVDIDINIDSLDLLERNEASGFLKVSVAARGAQEFIINPRSEAGIIFVNEIKSQTAGIGAADAESIILNREEVADVYISVWPFWSSKIPSLPENISVTLLQDASEN